MAELVPCRVCGVVPELETRASALTGELFPYTRHDCAGPMHRTKDGAVTQWNADNAAQRASDLAAIRAAVEAERAAAVMALEWTREERAVLDALLGGGE